jgi:hypothetical protein
MPVVTAPPASSPDETLDALLGPTHDAWIDEAGQLLMPPTPPHADAWDRWAAIRYLNEGLVNRLRSERGLVRELRSFLTLREAVNLGAREEQVGRLALALDRVARRRGSTAEFAAVAVEFLTALSMWCAEIELAGRHVRFDSLPSETQRKLELFEVRAPTCCLI